MAIVKRGHDNLLTSVESVSGLNADNINELAGVLFRQHGIGDMEDFKSFGDPKSMIFDDALTLAGGSLQTIPNSGVPLMNLTAISPRVIEILIAPNKAVEAFGEERLGNWTDEQVQIPIVEDYGHVSSYTDRSRLGRAGININWEYRDTYRGQTMVEYGELETAKVATAGNSLSLPTLRQQSAARVLDKFYNTVSLYGIAGKRIYGALNDPSYLPNFTPKPGASGSTQWENKTSDEIYNDLNDIYRELTTQTKGHDAITADTSMKLVMSPAMYAEMSKTNQFGLSVKRLIADNYPNLTITTIPELQDENQGGMIMMFAERIQGNPTIVPTFQNKLIMQRMENWTSHTVQKWSNMVWGTIVYYPLAVVRGVGY